jgi:hypothetical protein
VRALPARLEIKDLTPSVSAFCFLFFYFTGSYRYATIPAP